ncbi:MAG: alkaline phosphatase family protein [Polyangia bacterium]|nr:alkaline phosphatase family protein [Polyangia bacterium]
MLRALCLGLGVFLGGAGMTGAWITLFFTGGKEPDPAGAPPDLAPVRAPSRQVLWLVFDAMRAEAAFDEALMPNLARLRREGTWGIARTGTFTMTGTCVRALGTGMQPTPTHVIHNFRSPPIRADNLFRRLHLAGKRIVLIGDHIWVDLYRMTVSQSHPQPDLGIEDVQKTDRAALADAFRVLPKGRWDLAVVHLVGSDHAAHLERGVTGLYRKKLAEYDALIPRLRGAMGEDVTMLVVADHACNRVGNHGAGELEATRAPYVLSGRGVRALGRRDIWQTTFAPTITALLGAPAPWGAEQPGLLEALEVSPQERAQLALNHAAQRARHLDALIGKGKAAGSAGPLERALRRRLEHAKESCKAGDYPRCEAEARAVITEATEARRRAERAPLLVWVSAFGLLLLVPILLLGGGRASGPAREPGDGRADLESREPPIALPIGALVLGCASFAALLSGLGHLGAPLVTGAVALLAAVMVWPRRRESVIWRGLLLICLGWLLVLAGSFCVDLAQRATRSDPTGFLAAAPAALLLLFGLGGFLLTRPGMRSALRKEPAPLLAVGAAALFLPLPALRWWGGRHALFAGVALALVLALGLAARRMRQLSAPLVTGIACAFAVLVLGLAAGLGDPAGAPRAPLAWVIALGAPAAWALLALPHERRALGAGAAGLAAWALAQLPRLAGSGHELALIVCVLALALGIAILEPAGRAALLLCFAALFRLLAGDGPTLLVALFGAALVGFGHLRLSAIGHLGRAGLALGMALWELAMFSLLGRELSFDTIDVKLGFVGGGGLNLFRITLLVVLGYALTWWMLWVGLAPGLASAPGPSRGAPSDIASSLASTEASIQGPSQTDELFRLSLWILAVKVLGTFLLFLGRPAHFWLIHSLIPFQFFSCAHVLMVATGYLWARRLGREPAGRLDLLARSPGNPAA